MQATTEESKPELIQGEKAYDLFTGEIIVHIGTFQYEAGLTKRYIIPSQVVFTDLVYRKKENDWTWFFYMNGVNQPLGTNGFPTENEAIKFIAPIFATINGSAGNA